MTKKKNRRLGGETCSRAFKALYCSDDIEIPGDLRVIPYGRDGDAVGFYPTAVTLSYKCIDRMLLLDIAASVETTEEEFDHEYCMEADEEEVEGAHAEEQEYEADKILDCIVHSDESVEYLVKFKGYAEAEWIAAENTVGCKKLNKQYEATQALKELGTGMITSSKMNTTKFCAAVELNVKNEINGPNRKAVIAAMLREEKEMMSRRLRMLDSVQVSDLTTVQRKEAYRLRHLL